MHSTMRAATKELSASSKHVNIHAEKEAAEEGDGDNAEASSPSVESPPAAPEEFVNIGLQRWVEIRKQWLSYAQPSSESSSSSSSESVPSSRQRQPRTKKPGHGHPCVTVPSISGAGTPPAMSPSSSSPAGRQSVVFEALEIVQNETKLRIEGWNDRLKEFIDRLGAYRASSENIDDFEMEKLLFVSGSVLLKNCLLENDDSVSMNSYARRPVNEVQPTGIEALPIVLGDHDDTLQQLLLLRVENYFLSERVLNNMVQMRLDALSKLWHHEWRTVDEDPEVSHRPGGGYTLSYHLVNRVEVDIRRANDDENLDYIEHINDELRMHINDVEQIESTGDGYEWEHFDYDYPSYENDVKMISMHLLPKDVQELIPSPLLRMENKALSERAMGAILFRRTKWLYEKCYYKLGDRDFRFALNLPEGAGGTIPMPT